jgi:hypothetical protein
MHSSSPFVLHALPAHVILLDLIILIMFGEVYKLQSSWLYSFLQSPVISSLFGPHILLSTLFSNTQRPQHFPKYIIASYISKYYVLKYASDFSAPVICLPAFFLPFIKKKAVSICACVQFSTAQPVAQFPRICYEHWATASICDHFRRTYLFLTMAYLFFLNRIWYWVPLWTTRKH